MSTGYVLMTGGNAWTPQRFWRCRIIKDTVSEIEDSRKKGWVNPRPASEKEVKRYQRLQYQCDAVLGDVSDRFHPE